MVKKNEREIPLQFLPNKNRCANSALFGYQKNIITSFVPNRNKTVILLSTMHDDNVVNPEIHKLIHSYNSTKRGGMLYCWFDCPNII